MTKRLLLPLPDYQRVYKVIYSVLEASEIATTHRACVFFAMAGVAILREHYKLPATISAGCFALMVDQQQANVVLYGREDASTDDEAFHAWVECNGWMLDFMAPIMGHTAQEDGRAWNVPRRMLQKQLAERKLTLSGIQSLGDFFISSQRALAESLIDSQPVQAADLLQVCLTWYRRPPKRLREIALADSHGPAKKLVARAPSIEGVW